MLSRAGKIKVSKLPFAIRLVRREERSRWQVLMAWDHYLGFKRIVGESLCEDLYLTQLQKTKVCFFLNKLSYNLFK